MPEQEGKRKTKANILYVLFTLENNSDQKHKLTHQDIIDIVEEKYGVKLERKAVADCINVLRTVFNAEKLGLVSDSKGTYIDYRALSNTDIDRIITSIKINRNLTKETTNHLINLIAKMASVSYQNKKGNKDIIVSKLEEKEDVKESIIKQNLDRIFQAINEKKYLKFRYFNLDEKGESVDNNVDILFPVKVISQNGYLYMIAFNREKLVSFRVDRMKDAILISDNINNMTTPDFSKIAKLQSVFLDDPVIIEMEISNDNANTIIIDEINQLFGINKIESYGFLSKKITVKASPFAVLDWSIRHLEDVKVISPISLVNKIKAKLNFGIDKYK